VVTRWWPLLHADRLAHAARWAALDEIKGEHAQKRGGGAAVLDIDGVDEARILDSDGAEPERQASQDTLEGRERAQRTIAAVRESLGPKAVTYFLARANGASQAEAAAAAGVSERMVRKYQRAAQQLPKIKKSKI
jgi:DNA-directed RNA polymerase specialized sigma24 family protein